MNTIYKDDLAKEIGEKIGKPATKTKKLISYFEELIASELKSKDRVKLQNFGTFYLIHQRSRHIIQIRTKQRRILIGTTLIKFKPSLKVKQRLSARDEDEVLKIVTGSIPKPPQVSSEVPQTVEAAQIKQVPEAEAPEAATKTEEIAITKPREKPVEIAVRLEPSTEKEPAAPESAGKREPPERVKYDRVDGEKIRAQIRKRWQSIRERPPSADELLFKHHILETSAGGKLFDLAFKRVWRLGQRSLGFYLLSNEESCQLHYGKPRRKLAQVPRRSALEFLSSHLEIDDFDFPQERFVKLYSSSKMDTGWIVFAHTLPLAEGASIYIRLVKEL
jgi:nucleoid DNA-binding protein